MMLHAPSDVVVISDQDQTGYGYANLTRDGSQSFVLEQDGRILRRFDLRDSFDLIPRDLRFPSHVDDNLDNLIGATLSEALGPLATGAQFQSAHRILSNGTPYYWSITSDGQFLRITDAADGTATTIKVEDLVKVLKQ